MVSSSRLKVVGAIVTLNKSSVNLPDECQGNYAGNKKGRRAFNAAANRV
jgi:hypothetical protein